MVFLVAYGYGDASSIALLQVLFSLVFIYFHVRNRSLLAISPILALAIRGILSGFGNYYGFKSWVNQSDLDIFIIYANPANFLESNAISFLGIYFVINGWLLAERLSFSFKKIRYVISSSFKYLMIFILAVVIRTLIYQNLLPNLGTFTNLAQWIPIFAIFFFARKAANLNDRSLDNYARFLMVLEAVYAIFFEYLRFLMIRPFIAYILGYTTGNTRKIKWVSAKLIPIYLLIILIVPYFGVFGEQRSSVGIGLDRVNKIIEIQNIKDEETSFETIKNVLARQSNFNQLTSLIDLTKRNGFYQGTTLSYLAYAFIPRFIWPNKPFIAQGRWFALEIGQARVVAGRGISNSINMTIAGELYLNYSWVGLVIGCVLAGFVFAGFWASCNFWQDYDNLIGSFFGFYLFFLGLGDIGPDLQIFVTLIAVYLILLVLSRLLRQSF